MAVSCRLTTIRPQKWGVARIVEVAWEARQSSFAYTTQEVTAISRVDRACNIAGAYLLHFEPVAALPVGLQGGLEGLACQRAVDGDHAARRQFLACHCGQHQEGPRCAFRGGGARGFALNLIGSVDLAMWER